MMMQSQDNDVEIQSVMLERMSVNDNSAKGGNGFDRVGHDSGFVSEEEDIERQEGRCNIEEIRRHMRGDSTVGTLTPDETAFRKTLISAVSDLKRDLVNMRADRHALKIAGLSKAPMQVIDYCFLFVQVADRAGELGKSFLKRLLECSVHYYAVVRWGQFCSL